MSLAQSAVLADVPPVGRYVFFALTGANVQEVRQSLTRLVGLPEFENGQQVVGLGPELVRVLGLQVPGLHVFEALTGAGVSSSSCFWCRPMPAGRLDLRQLGL